MFEVILFDLGRVVVELGDSPLPKCWLKEVRSLSFESWVGSEIGRQFEKGELTALEFIIQLKKELELEQSVEEITTAFSAWPLGMYPKLPHLLAVLRERYHLAVLSNTNELHFPRLIEEFGIAEYFDTLFLSHHMGKAKPDGDVFEHVLDVLKVPPENVLFLDDNLQNVDAAAALGIVSVKVCGEEEVIQTLLDKKLLFNKDIE